MSVRLNFFCRLLISIISFQPFDFLTERTRQFFICNCFGVERYLTRIKLKSERQSGAFSVIKCITCGTTSIAIKLDHLQVLKLDRWG